MDSRIQGVIDFMRSGCMGSLPVSKIAERLGISRSWFEHLFKVETGRPFSIAFQEVRFAKATTLLADRRLRIKEVAAACGYSSTAGFCKAFRRRFGNSPSDYRRSTSGQQKVLLDNKMRLTT